MKVILLIEYDNGRKKTHLGLKSKLRKASATESCCLTTCYQHRMETSKNFATKTKQFLSVTVSH